MKKIVVIAAIVLCLCALAEFGLSGTAGSGAIYEGVITDLVNRDRHEEVLPELSVNPVLEKAAELKAEDMASKGYFAHTSPEGLDPWHWFKQAGYDYRYAGENLAVNFDDSWDVHNAWMNSPAHRANVLSGKYTEIGIASAEGVYEGRKTIFTVELFGNPSSTSTVTVSKQPAAITFVASKFRLFIGYVYERVLSKLAPERSSDTSGEIGADSWNNAL